MQRPFDPETHPPGVAPLRVLDRALDRTERGRPERSVRQPGWREEMLERAPHHDPLAPPPPEEPPPPEKPPPPNPPPPPPQPPSKPPEDQPPPQPRRPPPPAPAMRVSRKATRP